jgi:voltage-gated sodium channel
MPQLRATVLSWLEKPAIHRAIITLIIINAIVLGLETSDSVMAEWGSVLLTLDRAILYLFAVELALRLFGMGWRFFRDAWCVFDFVVVAIAFIPASGPFAVLRALRVLRVLRLISAFPSMRRVVEGLISALPGIFSISLLMGILFYVFSVMATKLFGESFPEMFGHMGLSMYTLFQIMTLEGWSGEVVRPIMEVYPYAWIFFIAYILTTTFTVLNLFIAVIVNAMQQSHEASQPTPSATSSEPEMETLLQEVRSLRKELQQLRERQS